MFEPLAGQANTPAAGALDAPDAGPACVAGGGVPGPGRAGAFSWAFPIDDSPRWSIPVHTKSPITYACLSTGAQLVNARPGNDSAPTMIALRDAGRDPAS